MDWQVTWEDPFTSYLGPFHDLSGDARTRTTLTETVQGIIGAGSLVCQRIAAHSPILAAVQDGAQRILRMVSGESTKRSPSLDAEHLTTILRSHAVEHLGSAPAEELWLIADGSDLRKPHARAMPHLMRVRSFAQRAPAAWSMAIVPSMSSVSPPTGAVCSIIASSVARRPTFSANRTKSSRRSRL